MSTTEGAVKLDVSEGLATIRLAGIHGNAINDDLLDGIESALRRATQEGTVRGLLLASAGKLFSPGLDLQILSGFDRSTMEAFLAKFSRCMLSLYTYPGPLVAAVSGHAVAGGCVLAMTADRRILRRGARIGLNEVKVGVPLPWGVAQMMREGIPPQRVEEVCLLGLNYADEAAVAIGLAHEVLEPEGFEDAARARLADLAEKEAGAFARTKEYLRADTVARIRAGEEQRRGEFLDCWFSPGTRERIASIVAGLRGGAR